MNFAGNNAIMYLLSLLKPELDKKADKNQGTENAGKYWMVGSDGDLTFGIPATGGNGNGMTGIANVKDYGAVGDGVENDTQAFLDAFDACNTVYVPHGTYVLNRMLIQNRTNITMIGYGATIKAIDNHPLWVGVLEFRNVTGLNLLGITVDGNKEGNSDYDQSRGSDNFRFVEVHNFLVKDCVSKNSFHGTMRFANSCSNGVIDNYIGDDIDVGIQFCAEDGEQYNSADDKSIFASHDIRITNCFNRGGTSEGIGFYECPGIGTVSAQYMHYNIEIDNCVFDSKSEGGVSSPFMNVKNLNIKNCKYLNTFGLKNTGLRLGQVEDVNVMNCTFEGVHHGALVLEGGVQKNVNITNCVFGKDCGSAITMSKTNGDTLDTTFKDCIFRDVNSENQWFGVDCNGVRFLNCSFEAKDVESNTMMMISKNISTDIINCTFEDAFGTAIPILTFAGDTNATVRLIGNTGLKHFSRWTITNINDTDFCVISNNECYDLNYSDESGDEYVTIYTLGLRYIEFKATNANPKLEKLAYYGKDNDVLTIKFVNAITLQTGKVSYTPMSARTVSAGSLVSFVCKNNKWIEIDYG